MPIQDNDFFLASYQGNSFKARASVMKNKLSAWSDVYFLVNDEWGNSRKVKGSNLVNVMKRHADYKMLVSRGGASYHVRRDVFQDYFGSISTSNITNISIQDLRQGHSTHDYGEGGNRNEVLEPYDIRTSANEDDFSWDEEDIAEYNNQVEPAAAYTLPASAAQSFFDGSTHYVTPRGQADNYGPMTINFSPALESDTDLAIFMYAGGATNTDRGVCASNQGGYFSVNGTNIQPALCQNGFGDGRRWLDLKNGAYTGFRVNSLSQFSGNAIHMHGGCHCIGGIRINGAVINGWFYTTFTFQNNSNFSEFQPGTDVYQTNDASKTGRVIRQLSNNRLVISSKQNNWNTGQSISKV